MNVSEIVVYLQPREPIFEKCSHLRDKGGVLTLRTPVEFVLTRTVPRKVEIRNSQPGTQDAHGPPASPPALVHPAACRAQREVAASARDHPVSRLVFGVTEARLGNISGVP